MRRLSIISLFLLAVLVSASAQEKYWIYFNSKTGNTEEKLSREEIRNQRSFPIHQAYLSALKEMGIVPVVTSKWLNAISALVAKDQVEILQSIDFINRIEPTRKLAIPHRANPKEDISEYTSVLEQINAQALIEKGLNGEGVSIGIIDGGFLDAHTDKHLDDIFYEDQYLGYRDFTGGYPDPFAGEKRNNDDHGTRVWRNIGGYDRDKDQFYGIATYADYYLAKSDRGDFEFRGEEDFWIAAIEWMDSLGIKIVNSSLGYSTGFDNPAENYLPEEIDGKSSPISQAAQIAASERGILIVASAGNEGNNDFKYLSVPADAKDVFTVGGCTIKSPAKLSFSSIGPPGMPYVKPDVCCYALGGTSFSAPVITGLAAAIKQHDPDLTNFQIMEIIRKSSHLYPFPNTYVGYGVPDGQKIIQLLNDPNLKVWNSEKLIAKESPLSLPSGSSGKVTVFHKSNETWVMHQEEVNSRNDQFIIEPPPGIKQTTVEIDGKVWEIIWE